VPAPTKNQDFVASSEGHGFPYKLAFETDCGGKFLPCFHRGIGFILGAVPSAPTIGDASPMVGEYRV
jgi:hypothetical protein